MEEAKIRIVKEKEDLIMMGNQDPLAEREDAETS